MCKYIVNVSETFSKGFVVDASSEEEAEQIVSKQFVNGSFLVGNDAYVDDVSINTIGVYNPAEVVEHRNERWVSYKVLKFREDALDFLNAFNDICGDLGLRSFKGWLIMADLEKNDYSSLIAALEYCLSECSDAGVCVKAKRLRDQVQWFL